MNTTKNNKFTQKAVNDFCQKIIKKKIYENEDLFKILDSLEIMELISAIEKKFQIKFNIIKLLNRKKLDLKDIKKLLK